MTRLHHVGLAAAFTLSLSAPLAAAEPIAGQWITEDHDAVITIGDCGGTVCGRVTRFLVPPPDGLDQRDINNPDKALRSRKLLGLSVLSGLAEEADLWRGQIYDPKGGRSYRSVVRRKGSGKLEVKGCIGPICQTQVWTRAS